MTAIKTKLMTTTAELDKAIASVIKRGTKLQQDIQVLGLSLLAHIDQHSNPTQLNALIIGFPKGLRRNALAEWAVAHGKVEINMDKETAQDKPLLFAKDKETKLALAESIMWTEFQPEKDLTELMDFSKLLAALLKKADKQGVVEGQAELLAMAKQLVAAQ